MSKTKVAPIKRLSIPRLELWLSHVKKVFDIPLSSIHAWTDSTVVLNWLDGSVSKHTWETESLQFWT